MVCELKSKRRTISITRFHLQGRLVLKIYERCGNGKVFFVIIPCEDNNGGWNKFLQVLQDRGRLPPAPSVGTITQSFAEVVAGKPLPVAGSCDKCEIGDSIGVRVAEEGIQERLRHLERCLVVRFETFKKINWNEFRNWANRSWGVNKDILIQSMGDDLWMMTCNGNEEVKRIMALNRWRFGDIPLKVDGWIKDAGRSVVLLDVDVGWVLIRGIPLHLRSTELVRSLGDICGGFLDSEEVSVLTSVRIKVKIQGKLPEVIPICYGDEIYPVRVDFESAPVPASFRGKSSLLKEWKGKNKIFADNLDAACSTTGAPTREHIDLSVAHRERLILGAIPKVVLESSEHIKTSFTGEETSDGVRVQSYDGRSQKRDDLLGDMVVADVRESASEEEMGFVVSLFDSDEIISLNSCPFPIKEVGDLIIQNVGGRIGPTYTENKWVGPESLQTREWSWKDGRFQLRSPINITIGLRFDIGGPWNILDFVLSFPGRVFRKTDLSCHRGSEKEKDGGLDRVQFIETDCLREVQSEESDEVNDSNLLETVEAVASLIGVKVDGSSEKGLVAVSQVYEEISKRRASSGHRTRTELELRRLGTSLEQVSDGKSRSRRGRYVVNTPLPYEF
ncbi:hypothetical protein LINGRAHAP2_LOCUS364 [Linum grandiflorum]